MIAKSQWFHWKERFPERHYLTNVKMETINCVETFAGNVSYKLNLNLSFVGGLYTREVGKSSRRFHQMNLEWEITSTNVPSRLYLDELKLESCAIKICMVSADGEGKFSKWLHLDPSGDEKTSSWKDFIPKAKLGQLILGNGKVSRAVSWEIVVFGRVYIRAQDSYAGMSHLQRNERKFDRVSCFIANDINCVWSISDSESSTVILAIDGRPEETVVANKFLLAACSPVLRKMLFEIDMEEKSSGRINLSDTSFLPLKTFIGLIRGDKTTCRGIMEFCLDEIFKVLALAHKYQVEGILDLCIMVAMAKKDSEMDISDARHLFEVGKLYEIPDLCTRSFEWIRRSSSNVAKYDEVLGFLEREAVELLAEYCYYFTIYSAV